MAGCFIPVILAGGAGTRLWPLSRPGNPKPFLLLADGESLLQHTYRRAARLAGAEEILAIIGADYAGRAQAEYAALQLPRRLRTLREPMGRNTAPAIAAAAMAVAGSHGADAVLLAMPADHAIGNPLAFAAAVEKARRMAEEGFLVTFGMAPDGPSGEYGYIQPGEALAHGMHRVRRFVEKPDADRAAELIRQGCFWNAGIFCFRADAMIDELRAHAPEIVTAVRASLAESGELGAGFVQAPSEPIDRAVMEKSQRVAVLPCDFGWSDLGTWANYTAHLRGYEIVHRPWGHYRVLTEGEGYRVKRLVLNPGAATSVQLHQHRNEHWTIESGRARVCNGGRVYDVRSNESTSVNAGVRHRLENPGEEPLVIIEIQMGAYLGEDDIVRFEDRYGRVVPLNAVA